MIVDRGASAKHGASMVLCSIAFCGLLATTPVWGDPPQDDQLQTDRFQDDHPQPIHKRRVVHRVDPTAQLRHRIRDEINNSLVGIVSEGTDETVDMALVLAAREQHNDLRLLPIAGASASQNAEDVLLTRGIDFGIVQADVMDQIKRNPPFPGVEKYVQYITRLYDRQVQILAGPDIKSLDDLRGKKVNFGLRDSGSFTTASAIFKALRVEPDITTLPHPLALDKLRRGDISALVYVATKPSRLFQDIRPDENLHFLPITGELPSVYTAIDITADDYPELVSKDAPINTVEVGTVMVAYNWPTNSERYRRADRFVQAFFAHVKDIEASHPKWHQFDITSSVSGWTRFAPAEQWLKKAGLTPNETGTSVAGLDTKQRETLFKDFQREVLFQEFAAYQKAHQPGVTVAYNNP
jgi:uncharacterized protein